MTSNNENFEVFNRDIEEHGTYLYTSVDRMSARMATQRTTDIILEANRFAGRSVLDLGCGDGYYTLKWWDQGKPRELVGVDAAAKAIELADKKKGDRPIRFQVGDAHHLPFPDNSFDLVLIQSILHHDDDPGDIIREAFRVAPEILIHEPNGNNLGLKMIEKVSRYHREHGERSYSSRLMARWIDEAGARVTYRRFAGFVPMFCSDWMAKLTKAVEPLVEACPLVKMAGCAVVVIVARRKDRP